VARRGAVCRQRRAAGREQRAAARRASAGAARHQRWPLVRGGAIIPWQEIAAIYEAGVPTERDGYRVRTRAIYIAFRLFGPVDVRLSPWAATYTTARYLDLLDTYSDHALLSAEQRAPLYEAIAEAIDRRGGAIEVPYVAMAVLAQRT
jgi:hypothetical protein